MTTIHWKSGVSGDWSDANRWREDVVPGAGDDAVIGASGDYQVTIDSPESANGITLNAAGATVLAEDTLTVGGDLTVEAGTFELSQSNTFAAPHGVIVGGTLSAPGGEFDWQGGTISAVTYEGNLTIGAGQILTDTNGLIVTGSGGSGPGVIDMTAGDSNSLTFDSGPGIDNITIDIGGPGNGSALKFNRGNGKFDSFALGPGVAVDVLGATNIGGGARQLDVEGSIVVAASQALVIGSTKFLEEFVIDIEGSLTLENDASVLIACRFANGFSSRSLTGGKFTVESGAILTVGYAIQKLYSTLTLDGAGSMMEVYSTLTGDHVAIDQSVDYVGLGGALEVLGGRDWTANLAFVNHGLLQLGGGTFAEASIKNSGTVEGFGTIAAPVDNSKTISAAGGVLEVTGAVTNTGRLVIGANSELKLDAAASATTATFAGAGGTLAMADPDSLGGKIVGFAVGDVIDLIGISATSAVRTPGTHTLVVSDNGTTVATLQLSGTYTHDTFAVASDGHGGTDITLVLPTAQLAQHMAAMAPASSSGAASHTQPAAAPVATLASPGG
ncbi:MAG TPA: hypothetical protein VG166_14710 [Caulobacteraceae bacterium]|nr:hypothetical protein [Caulobacteraceae bacterium]